MGAFIPTQLQRAAGRKDAPSCSYMCACDLVFNMPAFGEAVLIDIAQTHPLCRDMSKDGVADWAADESKVTRALGSYILDRARRNKKTLRRLPKLDTLKRLIESIRCPQEDSQAGTGLRNICSRASGDPRLTVCACMCASRW